MLILLIIFVRCVSVASSFGQGVIFQGVEGKREENVVDRIPVNLAELVSKSL